jgi:hypothetical protein
MKKDEKMVEIPKTESKLLQKFKFVKQLVTEHEFYVYAEDRIEAESLVDKLVEIEEYNDYSTLEVDTKYYDNGGYIDKVEKIYVGESWYNDETLLENMHEPKYIYQFDGNNWEEENTWNDEEEMIEEFKYENNIND